MGFLSRLNLKKSAINAIALVLVSAFYQKAFSSGYEFDGVGTAEVLRGGAVSADKGGWAHVYWNPAGIIGSQKSAGVEVRPGKMNVKDGNSIKVNGTDNNFSKKHQDSGFVLGSAGAVMPFGEKDALAFGVFTPLMNSVDFEDDKSLNPAYNKIDTKSFAGLVVVNISHSRKINEKISIGYGANILNGLLRGETKLGVNAVPPFIPAGYDFKGKMYGTGLGLEGVAGVKYDFNEKLSGAAVFRTGGTVKIEGDSKAYVNGVLSEKTDFTFKVKQPPTSTIGAVYRYDKTLKISSDFSQTWWNGFSDKITLKTPGTFLKNQPKSFDWRTSIKFRLGFEKALSETFSYMGGYAFDTPAIDKDSIDFSNAVDVPMHRFSAGIKKKLSSWDLSAGMLYGKGTRKEDSVKYALEGWFATFAADYRF
ncbi:MAG: outer membrane protein transport protein [Elusimicrobiota bacterium]